jgi:hypothetical protein
MMANRKTTDRQVNISVSRPEDLRLFEFMKRRAFDMRYPLGTFILVSLHEAFKGQIEEEEVSALAEEAIRLVQDRTKPAEVDRVDVYRVSGSGAATLIGSGPPGGSITDDGGYRLLLPAEPPPVKPPSVSMDKAMEQAEAQIASLDAVAATAMKKKGARGKGVPSPPPLPQ